MRARGWRIKQVPALGEVNYLGAIVKKGVIEPEHLSEHPDRAHWSLTAEAAVWAIENLACLKYSASSREINE